MNRIVLLTLISLFLMPFTTLSATSLTLSLPLDYQVIQRVSKDKGSITIAGTVADAEVTGVETRITGKIAALI